MTDTINCRYFSCGRGSKKKYYYMALMSWPSFCGGRAIDLIPIAEKTYKNTPYRAPAAWPSSKPSKKFFIGGKVGLATYITGVMSSWCTYAWLTDRANAFLLDALKVKSIKSHNIIKYTVNSVTMHLWIRSGSTLGSVTSKTRHSGIKIINGKIDYSSGLAISPDHIKRLPKIIEWLKSIKIKDNGAVDISGSDVVQELPKLGMAGVIVDTLGAVSGGYVYIKNINGYLGCLKGDMGTFVNEIVKNRARASLPVLYTRLQPTYINIECGFPRSTGYNQSSSIRPLIYCNTNVRAVFKDCMHSVSRTLKDNAVNETVVICDNLSNRLYDGTLVDTSALISMMLDSNINNKYKYKLRNGTYIYYNVIPILAANINNRGNPIYMAVVSNHPIKEDILN